MRQHQLYLVSYDIHANRTRARVARCLLRWGFRVQYSVFVVELAPTGLETLMADLEELIADGVDDIRFYPLPRHADVALMGRQMFPRNILLLQQGRNLLRLGTDVPRRN